MIVQCIQTQNSRQKFFNRGGFAVLRGLDILKIDKTLLIYSVLRFNLETWSFVWGGLRPPWRRDCPNYVVLTKFRIDECF